MSYQNVTPEQIPVVDQTLLDDGLRRPPRRRRPRHRLRRRRIVATHADQVHVPGILGENAACFKQKDLDKTFCFHFPS